MTKRYKLTDLDNRGDGLALPWTGQIKREARTT